MEGKAITLEPTRYYLLWACHASDPEQRPEAAPAPVLRGTKALGSRSGRDPHVPSAPGSAGGDGGSGSGFTCAGSSRAEPEQQQHRGAEGRKVSYVLVLSGDSRNHLQEFHVFCSCMFLSRKMNRCYSNQVSSCTEIWQLCANYLESCTVRRVHLHAHGRDPWKALLDSLNEPWLLLVFCEVNLCSLLKIINC